MFNCINKFTDKRYEAIQYNGESQDKQKVIDFIREYLNLSIRIIQPKIIVTELEIENTFTQINPSDYLIRTKTDGIPLYHVVSSNIMKDNFIFE